VRKLEIIASSVVDAVNAQAGGASSLEIVRQLAVGGLTPPIELVRSIRAAVTIPIRIIVRPHADNFVYSGAAVEQMLTDIQALKHIGADGIVFGALHATDSVNTELTIQIAQAAQPMEITFHRAIDVSRDPNTVFNALVGKVQRVLTSGMADNVWDGRAKIRIWVEQYGAQFTIACGGGIKIPQLADIVRATNAPEFHLGTAAQTNQTVDTAKVRQILEIINSV
jgi:copper homeostasis protein